MQIPSHWAEAEVEREHAAGRRLRVRRYGWSDESSEAAQAMAQRRAAEALERLSAGESVPRGESKRGYPGADGTPIREEILQVHEGGRVVVTRNSYGARCMNVADVLIADVDDAPPARKPPRLALFWMVALAGAARFAGAPLWLTAVVAALVLVAESIAKRVAARATPPSEELSVLARAQAWSRQHPDWGLRVYQTPAGHRILVTHRTFDCLADVDVIAEFFGAVGADPIYSRMCATQHCFRARLSPKPWRMPWKGGGLRPRGWPLSEAQREQRAAWVEGYEQASRGFSACRYTQSLGASYMPSETARVVELHDQMSGARSERPTA